MKKILSVALLLMFSLVLCAQRNVTKFLGIPVDGTKSAMIQKLKAKGFAYNSTYDCLEGRFNGENVNVFIATNNNKVCRIMVADADTRDEGQIKIKYNTLCRQFENNPKYRTVEAEELSDEEKISHEMLINHKQYQATYVQLPVDDNMVNRSVWFTIKELTYGKYYIGIFYDNEFNRAHGEDL